MEGTILNKKKIIESMKEEVENGTIEFDKKDLKNPNYISFFDLKTDSVRYFYYNEFLTLSSLKERVYISPKLQDKINFEQLLLFIYNEIDKNALMSVNKICFMYDETDYEWLFHETNDEYALFVNENENLGVTWVDNNICIIDIFQIEQAALEIEKEDKNLNLESSFAIDFNRGILETTIHELRHLLLECNIFVSEEEYPYEETNEENVENYTIKKYEECERYYVLK